MTDSNSLRETKRGGGAHGPPRPLKETLLGTRNTEGTVVVGSSPTMTVVLNSPLSFGQAVSQAPQKVLHCTQEVRALKPEHESPSATEHLWSSGYDVSLTR